MPSQKDGPAHIPEAVLSIPLETESMSGDRNEKQNTAFAKDSLPHDTTSVKKSAVQGDGGDVQLLKSKNIVSDEKSKITSEAKESGSLAYAAITKISKETNDSNQKRPRYFDTEEEDLEAMESSSISQPHPGAYAMAGIRSTLETPTDPSQNTSTLASNLASNQGIPPEPLLSAVLVEEQTGETRQSQELPYAEASTVPPEKPWWRTTPFLVGLAFLVIGVIVAVAALVATRTSSESDSSSIITVVATDTPTTSLFPSVHPTAMPTVEASFSPSFAPSFSPTSHPSSEPSYTPTTHPTSSPSYSPTSTPSITPTSHPSFQPSTTPTSQPTAQPSSTPSVAPTWSRLGVMQELVRSLSPTGDLPPVNSPQDRALNWAVYNDGANVPLSNTDRLTTRYALAAFFYSTEGDSDTAWFDEANFLSSDHECDWHSPGGSLGVDCNTNLRVVSLELVDNRIFGSIPEEIGLLTDLRSLNLMGRWSNGGLIYVQSNNLDGTLPTHIGQLENLVVLDLSGNDGLGGNIPSEIARLTNLVELHLADDSFSGNVPDEIGFMPSLTYLDLLNNDLTGPIPSSLDNIQCITFQGNDVTCEWFRRRRQQEQERQRELQAFSNRDTCTRYIPPCQIS